MSNEIVLSSMLLSVAMSTDNPRLSVQVLDADVAKALCRVHRSVMTCLLASGAHIRTQCDGPIEGESWSSEATCDPLLAVEQCISEVLKQ